MENKGSSSRGSRQTEHFVPVANVVRIMRRAMPPHGKISDDAKEMVQHCVTEFIGLVTAEANVNCRSESRTTITSEDILKAMTRLGFDNYVQALSLYMSLYRESESLGMNVSARPPPLMIFGPTQDPTAHSVLQTHNVVGFHGPSNEMNRDDSDIQKLL